MATLPAIPMKCVAMWEGLALIQRASATLRFLLSGCTAALRAKRKRKEKKSTERTEERWWCRSADSSQTSSLLTHVSGSEQRTKNPMFGSTGLCLHHHKWLPHTLTFRPQCRSEPRSWPHLYLAGVWWRSLGLYRLHLCESSIIINVACDSDSSGRGKEGKILF